MMADGARDCVPNSVPFGNFENPRCAPNYTNGLIDACAVLAQTTEVAQRVSTHIRVKNLEIWNFNAIRLSWR